MNLTPGKLYQYTNKDRITCYYSDKKLYSTTATQIRQNDIFALLSVTDCLNPKYCMFSILLGNINCFFYQINNGHVDYRVRNFKLIS